MKVGLEIHQSMVKSVELVIYNWVTQPDKQSYYHCYKSDQALVCQKGLQKTY